MNRLLLAAVVVPLYGLHQDYWFWDEARPLVFGFLPVGLAYHGLYCVAVSLLMWTLTRVAWPAHLERSAPETLRDAPFFAKAPAGRQTQGRSRPGRGTARPRRSAKREGGRR